MAVYTTLDRDEITAFIEPFGIGPLLEYEGVAAGIENTNYFLRTDRHDPTDEDHIRRPGEYVLTLFETQPLEDIRFHVQLTQLLARRGLPVPAPIADSNGQALHTLLGKPTVLIPRIRGHHPKTPTTTQCHAIGSTLAQIHRVALDAGLQHPGHRSLAWLEQTAASVRPFLSPEETALLDQQLQELPGLQTLPQSIIHGDLFRDNALFDDNQLVAVIDFFSAGSGYLLLDLAVVANDWCYQAGEGLDTHRLAALLSGYQLKRSVGVNERVLWPQLLQLAALRFWVSRLQARHAPEQRRRPGTLVALKDPSEYRNILQWHCQNPQPWPKS